MSETKRNVPKLRFPGFTEDWEQRKLGEISEKVLEKIKICSIGRLLLILQS